ncbi:unnamed protein product [Cuscuta europaea]|uniref:Uncharacterized protein n=1 Tax=Cuscuta europaea TaxID=41803 RepID=A0A9P0ZP39_CUSEU|nr:unnamed protein product [Cuscuta europaea]
MLLIELVIFGDNESTGRSSICIQSGGQYHTREPLNATLFSIFHTTTAEQLSSPSSKSGFMARLLVQKEDALGRCFNFANDENGKYASHDDFHFNLFTC